MRSRSSWSSTNAVVARDDEGHDADNHGNSALAETGGARQDLFDCTPASFSKQPTQLRDRRLRGVPAEREPCDRDDGQRGPIERAA